MTTEQPPIIRAQTILRRPRLTYAAVTVCALALIVAVVLASISFANQQRLTQQNRQLTMQTSRILTQTRAALAQTQATIARRSAASDARWCNLFGLLLSAPVATNRQQSPAQKALTARFLLTLTQQNREFQCPQR